MDIRSLITGLLATSLKEWAYRFGGPGLVGIAIVDNSFIPIPGGLDVATILLSSGHHELWPYYAFMATLGSVIGAYLTYRIGAKGGKETLEKKIGKKRAEKVYHRVENAEFMTLFVSVLMPPPFPAVPVLVGAGALQLPRKKFLTAVTVGRGVRFTIDGLLGIYFGKAIINFFSQYYKPALYSFIGLAVLGGIGALVYFKWWRPRHQHHDSEQNPQQHSNENVA